MMRESMREGDRRHKHFNANHEILNGLGQVGIGMRGVIH